MCPCGCISFLDSTISWVPTPHAVGIHPHGCISVLSTQRHLHPLLVTCFYWLIGPKACFCTLNRVTPIFAQPLFWLNWEPTPFHKSMTIISSNQEPTPKHTLTACVCTYTSDSSSHTGKQTSTKQDQCLNPMPNPKPQALAHQVESDIIATYWHSHKSPRLYIAGEPCDIKWQHIVKVLTLKFFWHKTIPNHYIVYVKNVLAIIICNAYCISIGYMNSHYNYSEPISIAQYI